VVAQGSPVTVSCVSNSGIFPTKAALAVAMGIELGKWDPLNQLEVNNQQVVLKAGLACIKNSCKNTRAILGQSTFSPDQNRFNPVAYFSDLSNSLSRQSNLIDNLTKNHPTMLPPAHKLTLVGGPTDLGKSSCGPHYIFQVDHPNGTPLSSAEATNMSNELCFYGQDTGTTGCGSNPFVGFTKTQTSCPSGRVCVAIDPTDGDNGSITPISGAPTYPLNRLWDPTNEFLNSACTKTSGPAGTMLPRCTDYPATCGYLYCM
jgi:hypothetical protein